jgi:hypothetical protein
MAKKNDNTILYIMGGAALYFIIKTFMNKKTETARSVYERANQTQTKVDTIKNPLIAK